ncbi:MAG: hypothetical protein PW734_04590 [Verrucomicrobium sp.]|nr:hypothetical protein [Verrucomicrobium sp.]
MALPRFLYLAPFLAPLALGLAWLLRGLPSLGLAAFVSAVDRWGVAFLLVRGAGLAASLAGECGRLLQVGNVRGGLFFLILGGAGLVALFL